MQSYGRGSVYDHYRGRSHRWHSEAFTDYYDVELVIDNELAPGADFAISADQRTAYIPDHLTPLGFHHRLIEVGITLSCGPDTIPELIRAARPFLAAAYGKLVTPRRYAR